MSTPQQPELHRSRQTPEMDLDNVESDLRAHGRPGRDDRTGGPTPPGNRPNHHPGEEQDKPDLDAFADKLGVDAEASQMRRVADSGIGKALAEVRHRLPDAESSAIIDRVREAAADIDVAEGVARTRKVSSRALVAAAAGLHRAATRVEQLAEQLEVEEQDV